MIKSGDYIREKTTGHLCRVTWTTPSGLSTIRFHDGAYHFVKRQEAQKVLKLSHYPGDPEVLEETAA